MKFSKSFSAAAIVASLILSSLAFSPTVTSAQDGREALQRGYRTGYSDGYMAGYKDSNENAPRGFAKHPEYSSADRAFNSQYGSIEDYKDGYRQGFEAGYSTGFEKKEFSAIVPTEISRRGDVKADVSTPKKDEPSVGVGGEDPIVIPKDTELILELEDNITTEANQVGDKFRAKVVSPIELTGMTIEGHVSKIRKPGRLRRKGELLLAFDRILASETRWSNISVILNEVLPVRGDNVKKVDSEGTVQGKGANRDDLITVATATGGGAIVGGVIGGPGGAAVGAGVGAVFGVGSVVVLRGRHVRLNRLQQLRLKTTYETKIR